MSEPIVTPTRAAVLARLCEAYTTAALCETWLALQAKRELEARLHRLAAAQVSQRQVELGRER